MHCATEERDMDNPQHKLRLSRAASRFGGTLVNPDCQFASVSTDSRSIEQGDLFVALVGDRFDGHQFIGSVADRACGLVVESPDASQSLTQWVVPDTTRALGQLAALKRDDFSGPVIAITGSSGKTSVKEMLAAILGEMAPVLATRGNFNNHIGVPLTLLSLRPEHEFAVVEMGASGPGEIAYLCQIASPDIVLVNNVLPAHLEGFGSLDAIARAKGEIYTGMKPGGTAVLNMDEPYCADWRNQVLVEEQLTFAVENSEAAFYASQPRSDDRGCWHFTLHTPVGTQPVFVPLPGKHNIANALAASACAYAAGADLVEIASGLAGMTATSGRMQVLTGLRGSQIIDDSYNANPGSVKAAVDALVSLPGKSVLVLGDMAELGAGAEDQHRRVGRYAAEAGIPRLLAVGELSAATVAGFGEGGEHFASKHDLIERLKSLLDKDSTVLIKGSRSARMETLVQPVTDPNSTVGRD